MEDCAARIAERDASVQAVLAARRLPPQASEPTGRPPEPVVWRCSQRCWCCEERHTCRTGPGSPSGWVCKTCLETE